MRAVVCGANDLAGAITLNALRPVFSRYQPLLLLCDDTLPKQIESPPLAEFMYFMSELPARRVFPLVEKRTKRPNDALLTPRELIKFYDLTSYEVTRRMSDDVIRSVIDYAPDIILSVRFLPIFKDPLLSLPRKGIYNIHSGALPPYGGVLSPMRAILNGDTRLGCTLHRVDAGIDTGPVVGVRYIEVQPQRSLLWYFCHLYSLCIPLFEDIIATIERGEEIQATAQSAEERRYYRSPSNAEIDDFLSRGYRFVTPDDYLELLGRFVGH
jgi:methionyl-tRNA formyltransferase